MRRRPQAVRGNRSSCSTCLVWVKVRRTVAVTLCLQCCCLQTSICRSRTSSIECRLFGHELKGSNLATNSQMGHKRRFGTDYMSPEVGTGSGANWSQSPAAGRRSSAGCLIADGHGKYVGRIAIFHTSGDDAYWFAIKVDFGRTILLLVDDRTKPSDAKYYS